jgi:acetyltransferase-like isoleucine patch superfamily enzyme
MAEKNINSGRPAMTQQQERLTSLGPLQAYRQMAVGTAALPQFLYYEFCTLFFSPLPGLIGLGLRTLLYPPLFKKCGTRPAFGRDVLIRGAKQIVLGKRIMLDDFSVLDCRGDEGQIEIGDCVSIGRGTAVVAKGGQIRIGDGANIGSNCRIATQSRLELGDSVLIAAYSYIGPGNHQRGDADTPLICREMEKKGGVKIGSHAWIGTRATILDGVTIGERAIIGAHSLVREDVPDGAVAVGAPARVIS